MASNVVPFQRISLDAVLREIAEMGPTARGVIAVTLTKDNGGHFRISGFMSKGDMFALLGLLDWVKADLLKDILDVAMPL